MPFPSGALQATGGELYAHLFENAYTGLKRNLFWNLRIEFEALEYEEDEWKPSAMVEWLTPGVHDWRELAGREFDLKRDPQAEASFYVWEHYSADAFSLAVEERRGTEFRVRLGMELDFEGLRGGTERLTVAAETWIRFDGILIGRDSFFPKPKLADLPTLIAPYINTAGFDPPELTEHGFKLAPRE